MGKRARFAVAIAIVTSIAGCSEILGLVDNPVGAPDGSAGDSAANGSDGQIGNADATVTDAPDGSQSTVQDGSADVDGDSGASGDGSTGVDAGDASPLNAAYADIGDAGNWTTFDTKGMLDLGSTGFRGAAYDGRYIYFAPFENKIVTRFDTTGDFTTSGAWETFDISQVDPSYGPRAGFWGAVFDGHYVYFVPDSQTAGDVAPFFGKVARFDVTAGFKVTGSWKVFDTSALAGAPAGFSGGAFDGRYIYLAPRSNDNALVPRLDTKGVFTDPASWTTFDTSQSPLGVGGFAGAAFDGTHIYFAPNYFSGTYHGVTARFATGGSFADAGSWEKYALTSKSASAMGYYGAVFDGRYVYYVPQASPTASGIVARFDTKAPFQNSASFETFDISANVKTKLAGFCGGVFDGRYVYFVAADNTLIGRFDTTGTFADPASWSYFDTTAFAPSLNYQGAAFDGRYIYFVPYTNGLVARFDVRNPKWVSQLPPVIPDGGTASFF